MAKSLRSKREKRLRTLRREIAEPFYDKKDAAKFAALEAALAAPKLLVRGANYDSQVMESDATEHGSIGMDVEMGDGGSSSGFLKPAGGVGKKKWKNLKLGKNRKRSKGRTKHKKKF